MFVVFEGPDNSGKSTALRTVLKRSGEIKLGSTAPFLDNTVATREPGGSIFAEKLRNFVIENTLQEVSGDVQLLLQFASRLDHLENVINPNCNQNKLVLCDRYYYSTLIYQVLAGGASMDLYETMLLRCKVPDLLLLFSAPDEVLESRSKVDGNHLDTANSRWAIRAHYANLIENFSTFRCFERESMVRIIDATASPEVVVEQCLTAISERLTGDDILALNPEE